MRGLQEGLHRLGASIVIVVAAITASPAFASTIPSWLDDGISKWNAANPKSQIRFVDIKDSFVWYDIAKSADISSQMIRERVGKIVLDHGYKPMDDEEMVTTGKPPVTSGAVVPKKCWSRSFVLNIKAQDNTKGVGGESQGQRQRMLTSLVCEDTSTWWAAFRVAD